MEQTVVKRNYGFDNIKFLLIFCMVLGHILGISAGTFTNNLIYRIIYSFHMPAFCLISGYFAKYNKRSILFRLLYTYILFQFLYNIFNFYIIKGSENLFQFATPYWILWYMLILVFFYLIIPIIDVKSKKIAVIILTGTFVLSLVMGYSNIGYFLTLSRFFSFLPFFVAGYYLKKWNVKLDKFHSLPIKIALTLAVVLCIVYLTKDTGITKRMLYGSYSYNAAHYTIWIKMKIEAIAIIWIAFLMLVVMPLVNRKIYIISEYGRNTLTIYLLHGFIIKILSKYGVVRRIEDENCIVIILLTLLIIILCGNDITIKIFNRIFTGKWLESLYEKYMRNGFRILKTRK